jgi:branched-chain amino acid transport system substrate-binding protein
MVAAANKLIFDYKIRFMIGGISVPPFRLAISQLLEDNKVLAMNVDGIGINSEMTPKSQYTFGSMVSRASYMVGWEQFLKYYPKVKTVAIIAPEDPSTVEDAQHLGDAAKAHGLKIVAEEHYPFGTADFYPMWTKLLTAKPDVIAASVGFGEWVGNIVKQGRELGFKGPFCFLMLGADSRVIAKMAGSSATDIFATNFDWTSPKMPDMVKKMGQIIKQKIGQDITTDSWMGFETFWLLAQAIENAQSIDPTVVRDAFEKMTKFETTTGPGKLGGAKTYGIAHIVYEPLPILRIMDGKVEHIRFIDTSLP